MILVIVGPTGVGKTKASIELAKRYNAIIINGDSMQVYQNMDIGTAKIKEEEKEGIPHYLFDIKKPNEMYTVYDYQKDVRSLLDKYKDQNIIIVGGTGLYIKAALYNYEFIDENINNDYEELSNLELYNLVKEKYPDIDIHQNNRKRLFRYLNKTNNPQNKNELLYSNVYFIGLTTSRDVLYSRINDRVDEMFKEGLLEEVKSLYDQNIHSKAINTGIGYKELYDYFDGNISLDEAKDLIKKRSRHYAKRQYTWFKNQMDIKWFNTNFNDFSLTIKDITNYIDNK